MDNLVKHLAVDKLREALECHDWHYQRSDDPRSYARGRDQQDNIRSLMNTIGDEQMALSLYNKYCPWIKSEDEVTPKYGDKGITLEEKCIAFLKERNYYISKQKS